MGYSSISTNYCLFSHFCGFHIFYKLVLFFSNTDISIPELARGITFIFTTCWLITFLFNLFWKQLGTLFFYIRNFDQILLHWVKKELNPILKDKWNFKLEIVNTICYPENTMLFSLASGKLRLIWFFFILDPEA